MTVAGLDAGLLVAGLLALAVLLGSARMAWRLWHLDAALRPRVWRTAVLWLAQVASAVLLYAFLFPPPVARQARTLVVLTARADQVPSRGLQGEHVIELPEATRSRDRSGVRAQRAPDLASALRGHPGTQRIRVIGAGLVARDRDAAQAIALEFQPAPLPRGLIELQAPTRVPASRLFAVAGRARALDGGVAELLDPAGARVDRAGLGEDGGFNLHTTTRNPGSASYRLRLHSRAGKVVDDLALPIVVTPTRKLRVRVLAGAPNAELKYLRRWALDAGIDLDARIDLGAGLQLGRAPAGLGADSLAALDLLVMDERSWAGLSGSQRGAVLAAVDRGLGLLLRMTGPLSAGDRQRLRNLGFDAVGAGTAGETRLGAGFASAGDVTGALPTITRGAWTVSAPDGVVLIADARSAPLVAWRASGRGRVGVTTLGDSFRLVLGGRSDAHGEVWGSSFTAVARAPGTARPPAIEAAPPHQRSVICGIQRGATVEDGSGRQVELQIDPVSGAASCAGFWALESGWHRLGEGARDTPFFVPDPVAAPALQARELREATQALAAAPVRNAAVPAATGAGPRWPWFLGWLLLAGAGWWFERSRLGLARTAPKSAGPKSAS